MFQDSFASFASLNKLKSETPVENLLSNDKELLTKDEDGEIVDYSLMTS